RRLLTAIYDCFYKCVTLEVPIEEAEFPKELLYYKNYNLRRNPKDPRNTLDELIWKRSELTGKYIGCPYWSVAAKVLFDKKLTKLTSGRSASLFDAEKTAESLNKLKGENGLVRADSERLIHEHVFPRNHLIRELQSLGTSLKRKPLERLIERFAVDCVLLKTEDSLLIQRDGDPKNLWQRYRTGTITLVDNPAWPAEHRRMINAASLV
ncbi:MAG: hypothetical protein WBQ86_19725, partial [Candidatus Binatus sp.]